MPLLITQQQYDHAIRILTKQEQLPPIFAQLQAYLRQKHDIDVIDFYCERIQNPSSPDMHNKIQVVGLARQDVYQKFGPADNHVFEDINQAFVALCQEHGFYRDDLLARIGFYNFVPIYKAECVSKAAQAAKPVMYRDYENNALYQIINSGLGVLTVFFFTQSDVEKNERDGVCAQMKKLFYAHLKESDRFDWLSYNDTFIEFDSKETLDRDYSGNLYYYYK